MFCVPVCFSVSSEAGSNLGSLLIQIIPISGVGPWIGLFHMMHRYFEYRARSVVFKCGMQKDPPRGGGGMDNFEQFTFHILNFLLSLSIHPFSAAPGLCYCSGLRSCSEWGPLSSRGVWASHYSGLSCCRAQAQGLRGCGSRTPKYRLSSCGSRTWFFRSVWDPPRSGIEPEAPALAGGFSTTEPPGKPFLN